MSCERTAAGLYVHFPFCSVRCSYCDFPTVAGRDDRIGPYLDALLREIEMAGAAIDAPVDTIYVGGGTPSRLDPDDLRRLLVAIGRSFEVRTGAEVTVEGNPESLSSERLEGWVDAGVGRISVGVQSLDDRVLRLAGRAHDGGEALRAIERARAAGCRDLNVDLIAGLPGEEMGRWGETVRRVADAGPDHVSVYLLETDKDTPLGRAVRGGTTVVVEDDGLALAYETTARVLEDRGLEIYEISNFARPGHRSRHNTKYWTDAEFEGLGLGAHAYVAGERRANRRDLDGYIEEVDRGRRPLDWREPPDAGRRLGEALMLGLRMVEGVDLEALRRRYGFDPIDRYREAWDRGIAAGIVIVEDARAHLTPAGRIRSNELFVEFI